MHEAASLVAMAAIAVGATAVASAMAQDAPANKDSANTDLAATVKVTPSKAGTKGAPQGVTISASSRITVEPGLDPPIITRIDLLLGQGFSWNGGTYVTCSKRVLDRQGPKGCPKESVMGGGIATTRAGTVDMKPAITLVNGGATRLFAYTRFEYPARVHEAVVYRTADMTGKWGYRSVLRVPKRLQVIAGVPIQTSRITLSIGGKPYAKNYITTTSCPQGGWKYKATAHYLYNLTGQTDQGTISGTIPCTS